MKLFTYFKADFKSSCFYPGGQHQQQHAQLDAILPGATLREPRRWKMEYDPVH